MERNLTSGSVFKNIIFFSLPYLLSYFLQTLYGMADLYIIGQFDAVNHITSVSVGSQVMHMITVMIVGLAMRTTVSIGQAGTTLSQTISVIVVLAAAFGSTLISCIYSHTITIPLTKYTNLDILM